MKKLALLLFIAIMVSCNDDGKIEVRGDVNWTLLKTGVINKDIYLVDDEISKLLKDTNSKPDASDLIGQKSNLENLINEINKSGKLNAELTCYACIETYPAQSEILITTDSAGVSVSRIIDILTPDNNILKFVNIHNAF